MSPDRATAAPGVSSARFFRVAVNTGQPSRRSFTYHLPPEMDAEAGQAVFVPFGPRILQGILLGPEETLEIDPEQVRPVAAVADDRPVLDSIHIALAEWMSRTYLAPLWECIATCLPSGYGQRSVIMVSPVRVSPLLPVYPKDQALLQYIAAHGRVTLETLRNAIGPVSVPTLERLQAQGYLTFAQGLARPAGRPKTERHLQPLRSAAELRAHAAEVRQRSSRSVVARLADALAEGELTLAEARALGATPRHVMDLKADGWLAERDVRLQRHPLPQGAARLDHPLTLSPDQDLVARTIAASPGEVFLLYGVTGAGKTEVYLDLIARTLSVGRSAIVLVPEIALTPQAIRRFGERFGDAMAVFHSGLGTGELYDQWYRVQQGELRLVLGPRSAIFAPVQRLGLIVMDEEHEWSFKQNDPPPRYHTRAVAEELSRLAGATLVLGTATPDITTYYRTEQGSIRRLELLERLQPAEDGGSRPGHMPVVSVVDMRDELRIGNRSVFSFALRRATNAALDAGEQAILYVNRRGAARFLLCRDCGYIQLCPGCEVPMSLDMREPIHARLLCYYCGRTRRLDDRCPKCDSARYRPFGVGTQRIEAEARTTFPRARVARWDSDVASTKGSHERIVRALEAREIDILVGTQMLARGLDLAGVTVVGVVDADVGLGLPDFRAHERTYQLLSQVAGRAGRRDRPGFVYVQTYNPDAPPIVAAAEADYLPFYTEEIAHRRRAGYPPFTRLVKLLFHHSNADYALQEATRVADEIRVARDAAGRWEPDVLGPTKSFLARLRGQYRWQIILRGRQPVTALESVRLGEGWSVDVDPASLL